MKKILLIEDEKMLSEMYAEKLSQSGYEVFSASSAEEGLELLKKEEPNLILLDILLPRKNGISFLKDKKNMEEKNSIPVVAFSNYNEPKAKSEARKLGVKDYLIKTDYTPQKIVDKVKEYLED